MPALPASARRSRRWMALAGLFAALQGAFFVVTFLAAAVPNGAVVSHLRSAIGHGEWTALDYSQGTLGDEVDHFTECIALTIGIGTSPHSGIVGRALANPELGPCDTAVPRLQAWDRPGSTGATGGGVSSATASSGPAAGVPRTAPSHAAYQEYYRYWHGYTIVTRPVLAVLGVGALRVLVAGLLVVSLIGLLAALVARVGWLVSAAFAVPLLVTTDFWDLPGSVPHALSMAVALGGAAAVLITVKPGDAWSWVRGSLVAGSAYGFVDLMTNPPLAWAVTAFAAAAGVFAGSATTGGRRVLQADTGRSARAGLVAAAAWLAGYAGTWAVKWVIDIVAFGWHAFWTQVVHEITYRAGGAAPVLQVVQMNLHFWSGPVHHRTAIAVAVLGSLGVAVAIVAGVRRRVRASLAIVAALSWPCALTFVLYAVVREQSYIQGFFTYRSLGMSLAIAAAALAMSARSAGATPGPMRTDQAAAPREGEPVGDGADSLRSSVPSVPS